MRVELRKLPVGLLQLTLRSGHPAKLFGVGEEHGVDRIKQQARFSNQQGVFVAVGTQQERHVFVQGLRAVGAQGIRLSQGEVRFLEQALFLGGSGLELVLGRAFGAEPPAVDPADGAPEF